MSLRTLYLTSALSVNGRQHFTGRQLHDRFAAGSEAVLLAHAVVSPDKQDDPIPSDLASDLVLESTVQDLAPNVIYLEGGLAPTANGEWRYPRRLLEEAVRSGATAIVADADLRVLTEQKDAYLAAVDFLGAQADYGLHGNTGRYTELISIPTGAVIARSCSSRTS